LQKGTKEYHIVVGGLLVLSMETMVTVKAFISSNEIISNKNLQA